MRKFVFLAAFVLLSFQTDPGFSASEKPGFLPGADTKVEKIFSFPGKPGSTTLELDHPKAQEMFAEGLKAYEDFDFPKAAQLLRPFADRGDPLAQFHMGRIHMGRFRGSGTVLLADADKAVEYYRLSANQGFAKAQLMMGVLHRLGQVIPKNEKESFRWVKKAADQGLPEAITELAQLYRYGFGVPADDKKARSLFFQAARGDESAQKNLSLMQMEGKFCDPDEAMDWMLRAADQGGSHAQVGAAAGLLAGMGSRKDDFRAVALLLKSALDQVPDAADALETYKQAWDAMATAAPKLYSLRLCPEKTELGIRDTTIRSMMRMNVLFIPPPRTFTQAEFSGNFQFSPQPTASSTENPNLSFSLETQHRYVRIRTDSVPEDDISDEQMDFISDLGGMPRLNGTVRRLLDHKGECLSVEGVPASYTKVFKLYPLQFPDQPLKVGDSWVATSTISLALPNAPAVESLTVGTFTLTMVSSDQGEAIIDGLIDVLPISPTEPGGGKASGKILGRFHVRVRDGLPTLQETLSRFFLDFGGGNGLEGMEWVKNRYRFETLGRPNPFLKEKL